MKKQFKRFLVWIEILWKCRILRGHDWTCDAAEGIPATPQQLAGGVDGFYDYVKMYCRRCGYVSKLSERFWRGGQ
jgi:hypothetical protein